MTQETVLAMMAHPDDAEILCAGTLIRLRKLGWAVHIASMTPGDCGSTTLAANEISALRLREAASGAKVIGAMYRCLDERDGHVVYDKQTIQEVVALFRQIVPTLVITHALRDYMMDHEMTA